MKLSIQTIIWTTILIAIGVAGVLAFIPKPVDVETAVITSGTLRVSVQEDGKTRIREKYLVSAPVAGRLSRIELRAGDEIGSLDVLLAVILPSEPAILDIRAQAEAKARVRAFNTAVQRAETAANQAASNHELLQTKFDRVRKLHDTNAVSQDEYDIARTALLVSTQAVNAANFEAEIARYELQMAKATANQYDDSRDTEVTPFEIFTPICGKVLRVFEESATAVEVGAPLIEVGDPANLELEIDVLSTDAVQIKPGAELTIEHWGGQQPLKGHVRVIEPSAFTKTSSLGVEEQRVNIIADFDEASEGLESLGDGYRVEARITVEHLDNVLLLPNSALFRKDRKSHVWAVVNGRATRKQVEIGLKNEMHTQIISGLNSGEEVVVYPDDKLTDGSRVKTVNRTLSKK